MTSRSAAAAAGSPLSNAGVPSAAVTDAVTSAAALSTGVASSTGGGGSGAWSRTDLRCRSLDEGPCLACGVARAASRKEADMAEGEVNADNTFKIRPLSSLALFFNVYFFHAVEKFRNIFIFFPRNLSGLDSDISDCQ